MLKRHIFRSSGARALAIATIAALTLPAFEPTAAAAAPRASGKAQGVSAAGEMTDVSSARRRHVRRGGGGGNAAAAAAFAGIIGTVGAIAASQSRRDYYEDRYYGGPGYGYYGGGPAYGPGYGYGGGYYGGY